MAERVAPGHLKINDENLAADAKYAFLNVKSKNSKTDGKDGGSGIAGQKRKSEALDDNTKERSPQPEASSKEDFLNVEEEGPERKRKALDDDTKKNSLQTQASPKEEDLINKYKGMPLHAHSKCIHSAEKQRAARMMRMRLTQKKKFPQKNEDGCISIQGLKKAHVFLQFSTSPELSIPVVPAGFTGL